MTGGEQELCIIVPAYNEADTIVNVIGEVRTHAPHAHVVVVDDASQDRTGEMARSAGASVLEHPINLDIGGAMRTGLTYAKRNGYQYAMQVDGDGQHNPRHIPELLAPLRSGEADMVIGSRFLHKVGYRSSFVRMFGIRLFAVLIGLVTNQRIFDSTSGYRAYNRRALEFAARTYPSDFPEPESIVTFLRSGFRVKEVPVAMRERAGGQSSVRPLKGTYFVASNAIAILVSAVKTSYQ